MRAAEQRAEHERRDDADRHDHERRQRMTGGARREPVHQPDHDARDQRGHRADRQIDAARDDHEGHADRDDADERRAREHVHQVVERREVAIEQRADDAQQDQPGERPERIEPLRDAQRAP
ncbi:hypothetical protein OKW38_003134 [Paraburkholderia sp. MM5496-R1]